MTRLIVRPAAEADILDAQMWYSARDGALADRFIDELRTTLTCLPPWSLPDGHSSGGSPIAARVSLTCDL